MANTKRLTAGLPDEVRTAMASMGANLRLARKRRRLSLAVMAKKLMVSSPTLQKLERGDPTVSVGVLMTTMWALGMLETMKTLAAPETDQVGLTLELQRRFPKGVKDDYDF